MCVFDLLSGRLKFLDSTLERIIQRFEDEYPECRLDQPAQSTTSPPRDSLLSRSPEAADQMSASSLSFRNPFSPDEDALDDADRGTIPIRPPSRSMSRYDSDVSMASRHLGQEEGRMLRFGQSVTRDLFRPQTEDYHHGTTGEEIELDHIQELRQKLEVLSGSEIRDRIESIGYEAAAEELREKAEKIRLLKEEDPEAFAALKEAQKNALNNIEIALGDKKSSSEDGEDSASA